MVWPTLGSRTAKEQEQRTGLNLPEVVTLASERRQYRQFVHKIAKATHGGHDTRMDSLVVQTAI